MTKIVSNIGYTAYVVLLLYYLYLTSYQQYINTRMQQNYEDAQDTVISYTHKKMN